MAKKTVGEKMYIKPGMQIGLFNAPDNLSELLGGLPDGVEVSEELEGRKGRSDFRFYGR